MEITELQGSTMLRDAPSIINKNNEEIVGEIGNINKELTKQAEEIGNTYTKQEVDEAIDKGGKVKTVNEIEPDEKGNIELDMNNLPLGHIRWIPNVLMKDASELVLDGQTASSNLYAKLLVWANDKAGLVITETEWQAKYEASQGLFVPYFSIVDDNTFRLPCLKAYAKGGDKDSSGQFVEAGLPNITGEWNNEWGGIFGSDTQSYANGAFQLKAGMGAGAQYNTAHSHPILVMDASRSSSIYGKSDTVTPNTMQGVYVIKAFSRATNVGDVDMAEVVEEVGRLGTEVSTLKIIETGADYVVASGHTEDNSQWYRRWKSGWLEQGGIVYAGSGGIAITINFVKPYRNSDYVALANAISGRYNDEGGAYAIVNKTSTSFGLSYGSTVYLYSNWYACGMGANE